MFLSSIRGVVNSTPVAVSRADQQVIAFVQAVQHLDAQAVADAQAHLTFLDAAVLGDHAGDLRVGVVTALQRSHGGGEGVLDLASRR